MFRLLSLLFIGPLLLLSQTALAYFSVIDSGELVPKDQYRFILEPQFGHFNITAHFDAGITDESQSRVSIGAGEDGTHFDFYYKTIPIPDVDSQPAIGYKIGTSFLIDQGNTIFSLRLMPLISKTFVVKKNNVTPYFSVPLSLSMQKGTSATPIHAVFGTEMSVAKTSDMQIGFELGASIKDSFSYASGFITFYFEPDESEFDVN